MIENYKVTNIDLVPEDAPFLMIEKGINDKILRSIINKANGHIPGIDIYEEKIIIFKIN